MTVPSVVTGVPGGWQRCLDVYAVGAWRAGSVVWTNSAPTETGCSRGPIYNIGFEAGVNLWHRYLRPGGTLVVSETTWFTHSRPTALEEHWLAEYPEIDTASAKLAIPEKAGFSPTG